MVLNGMSANGVKHPMGGTFILVGQRASSEEEVGAV